MKKLIAIFVAFIMISTVVVGCAVKPTPNDDDNSVTSGRLPESSSIGGLSSSFGGSSSENGGSSSSKPNEEDPPKPIPIFDRISQMDGNIFSYNGFSEETKFFPLYTDDITPGKWTNATPKGLYQNFSVKNNEGSPKTNYVETKNGIAELVDTANGGTKMIIDFGDNDIDNGAIEGYFEFEMIDVGAGWTPFQFFGTDKVKTNSEILGIRTESKALADGSVKAGIRIDGDSANLQNPNIVFATGGTYSVHFDFNIIYGRFTFTVNCLNEPYSENYVHSIDMDVSSVQGVCFSTSDSGTRRGALRKFALSYYDGTKLFVDELNNFANYCVAISEQEILKSVEDLCKEFEGLVLKQTEKTPKALLAEYKQKIYDVYTASNKNFVVNYTMAEFIDYFLDTTPSYKPSWASEGFKNRWNYIDGVFLEGLVQNYERTGNAEYKDFFIRFINYYVYEEGKSLDAKFRKAEASSIGSAYNGTELDSVCESRILFDAYEYTQDKRYLEAIDFTYSKLKSKVPKAGDSGCYSHKETYKGQIWLDGFYMYAPFTIRYANLKNDTALRSELTNQFRYLYEHLRDDKGLYRHGMDVTKTQDWADKETGVSQSVWLRGEGWLLASLIDCIEYYPQGEDRSFLEKMFAEAMESIVKYQDSKAGMYYNVVDLDPTVDVGNGVYNYLETSGSSLVAYASLKGARLGVLTENYYSLGEKAFKGVYDNKLQKVDNKYVLKDIILSAGLGGHRNGTPAYYMSERKCENDGKGVGPFLMAYNEYALYSKNSFTNF